MFDTDAGDTLRKENDVLEFVNDGIGGRFVRLSKAGVKTPASELDSLFAKNIETYKVLDKEMQGEIRKLSREIDTLSLTSKASETRVALQNIKLQYHKSRMDINSKLVDISKTKVDLAIKMGKVVNTPSASEVIQNIGGGIGAKDVGKELYNQARYSGGPNTEIKQLKNNIANPMNGVNNISTDDNPDVSDLIVSEEEERPKSGFGDKNYEAAAFALRGRCINPKNIEEFNKNKEEEVVLFDRSSNRYWYALKDNEGNYKENPLDRHIDFLKLGEFRFKEGVAMDTKGEKFKLEEIDEMYMPDKYKRQWEVSPELPAVANMTEE